MRRFLPVICLAVVALVLAPASLASGGKHVTITGSYGYYQFSPQTVTVKKGKTVHWSWSSDERHNVTFGPKLNGKHSATKRTVNDFAVTFNKAGTFHYSCTVHGFTGKVVVTKPQ